MHDLAFNWVVVTYFFLGGLSAGSFLFSVAANYWLTDYKPLAKKAALVSLVTLAIGMLFLLLDLGQPMRAWRLFFAGNPTAIGPWGTWFLTLFGLALVAYIWFLYKNNEKRTQQAGYIGVVFAILVGTYTAFVLQGSVDIELWNSPLLPFLFLNSGIISGIALVLVVAVFSPDTKELATKGNLLAGLIVLELAMLVVEMLVAGASVVTSSYATLFWVLEITFGALIPLALLLSYKRMATQLTATPYLAAVAPILVLIGIFTMRYIVVIGGQV
jgi:formate-dependent nitrite reductase membrane component NrfD